MSEILFSSGKWVLFQDQARLPDGRMKTAIRAKLPDTAHIVASPSPGRVLLLREYRPFHGHYIWMVPSGHIDQESDPVAGALRELREETGYEARQISLFFTCRHKEDIDYTCYVYRATDLHINPLPADADESIEVHDLTVAEALERVWQSPVVHTISALALLRYSLEQSVEK